MIFPWNAENHENMIFTLSLFRKMLFFMKCIDIGHSSGDIGLTHSRFPKYLGILETEWNAHQIDILDNLFN